MSDDLTSGLRELAETAQAPPPVSGAEIRRRAGARRRRRRTAVVATGASAAVALALTLVLSLGGGGDTDQRPLPAASPTGTPSTQRAPDATVRLDRLTLTTGGRELPVTAGVLRTPTPTGRMTVTAREEIKAMSGGQLGLEDAYDYKVPWVIEARAPDGTTTYLGGLTYDDKAPGNYVTTSGWIGLRTTDARWLYQRLRPGDVIEVEGTAPTYLDRTAKNPTTTPPERASTPTASAASAGTPQATGSGVG